MTFIPQNQYSKKDLITCGDGELFGIGNGRLPSDQMLMFDEIESIFDSGGVYDNGHIKASLNINPELWFFDCHFKEDPVMPGCLGLDAMWQLVGFYLCWLKLPGYGRALGVDKVKFFGQVTPKAKLVEYKIDMKRVVNRGAVVGFGDGDTIADAGAIGSASNSPANTQVDGSVIKAGIKYVSGDITLALGATSGEAKDSTTTGTNGTTDDAHDSVGASVTYAVASGVSAILGYTSVDIQDEGATSNTGGSAWYLSLIHISEPTRPY